jgi:hypothetical protein
MSDPVRAIEEFFSARYGREALYVPSGRLALYLAFREWLHPGDRLLLSPVNDDVVFFTVLAAGLVPVLGPLDAATGNLDVTGVGEDVWRSLRAVMTTNLYGIPDRMDLLVERCRRHDLLLIEDACQALDSRSGDRRIGEHARIAAFSLTKHVAGVGGVLCFSERERRASVTRRAEEEIQRRSPGRTIRDRVRLLLREAAVRTGARRVLARPLRGIRPAVAERAGHRMPYDLAQVLRARDAGAGLDRFDRWVRMDNPRYRTDPLTREIRSTEGSLRRFAADRQRRLEGARRLLALGLTPPSLLLPEDTALFRVPLFVQRREEVVEHFSARGLRLDYIYDPPLDLYAAPALAERLESPDAARVWSRDVLPVDPLRADEFFAILGRSHGIVRPATEPLA